MLPSPSPDKRREQLSTTLVLSAEPREQHSWRGLAPNPNFSHLGQIHTQRGHSPAPVLGLPCCNSPFPKPSGQGSRKSLNHICVSQARASDAPSHSAHQPPPWMSQGLGGIYFLIPGVPRRHSGSLDLGTKAGPTSVQCQ